MFYSCEESVSRKIWYFPLRNLILSLVLPRNAIMLYHLIIQFLLYYLSSGCLWEVKNKENVKLLALKVVGSLKRGGHLEELVASGGLTVLCIRLA